MSHPKFCKTCEHWEEVFKRDKRFGTCTNPVIEDKIVLDREHEPDDEETVIHTDENFGCIYHTPLHGNVVAKLDING